MTILHEQMTARLMARYGGAATLTVPGGIDPSSPPYDPIYLPAVTYTVQLIETGAEAGLADGTLIQAGDVVAAMLPHASTTPAATQRLTIGGKQYTILSVSPIRSDPEGPVVYFRLHARA